MAPNSGSNDVFDIFVIGGGVNGCGIARDAAGRGLSVALAEMNDLASATSSASTKLFHGGLRYLEYYKFRLVREALIEREVLLRAMPHISWPMRFVLPYHNGMRPAWLLRTGLFIYDHLGGRKILPATKTLNLANDALGTPLKKKFQKAFEYSDCWVQDSRLVVLNARDAQERGARILVQTKVVSATRVDGIWKVELLDKLSGETETVRARVLVNAAGPWVSDVVQNTLSITSHEKIRLVRGSHIVTKKLFGHDRAYFFQGADGRIVFAIPYEDEFTLIGTTDQEHDGAIGEAVCSDAEVDYLCAFASEYFDKPVTPEDVVWRYSGVRPLYDDGAKLASEATRDYVLSLDEQGGAPVLNVFGGKITTYRRLAESAIAKLEQFLPDLPGEWTAEAPLPGGNFPVDGVNSLITGLEANFLFLGQDLARRLIKTYGTDAGIMLAGADSLAALGQDFGAGIYATEIDWLMEHEFARTADDVLWRRTRLGLHQEQIAVAELETYMADKMQMMR